MHSPEKTSRGNIPAFTLPELVVGLLLMAIFFSIVATVHTILVRQSAYYFAANRFFTDYYITKKLLQQDFEKAGAIRFNPESRQIILQHKRGVIRQTIIYQLDTAFIIRTTQGRSDTLLPGAGVAAHRNVNDSVPQLTFLKLRHNYGSHHCYTILRKRYAQADMLNDSIDNETVKADQLISDTADSRLRNKSKNILNTY